MKRNFFLILTLFIISVFCLYFFYHRNVNFDFFKSYPVKNKIDHPFLLTSNKDVFIRLLNDSTNDFHIYSDIINIDELNFEKYDYMVTFGKRLKSLYHSPYYSTQIDKCSYLKQIPIKAKYINENIDNNIYIYIINVKNRYRLVCP